MNEQDTRKVTELEMKLTALVEYYGTTRHVGHTFTMVEGFKNSPRARVVVPHYHAAQHIKCSLNDVISLHDLYKLKGLRAPLAWDNFAIATLLQDSLETINILKQEIKGKEKTIEHVALYNRASETMDKPSILSKICSWWRRRYKK